MFTYTITPDILHQLYQGIMKHTIGWATVALSKAEIDARCRRMPPNHNVRLFLKGITSLSRVTGQEHDQMCQILLGLIIDISLEGGFSNVRLIKALVLYSTSYTWSSTPSTMTKPWHF